VLVQANADRRGGEGRPPARLETAAHNAGGVIPKYGSKSGGKPAESGAAPLPDQPCSSAVLLPPSGVGNRMRADAGATQSRAAGASPLRRAGAGPASASAACTSARIGRLGLSDLLHARGQPIPEEACGGGSRRSFLLHRHWLVSLSRRMPPGQVCGSCRMMAARSTQTFSRRISPRSENSMTCSRRNSRGRPLPSRPKGRPVARPDHSDSSTRNWSP